MCVQREREMYLKDGEWAPAVVEAGKSNVWQVRLVSWRPREELHFEPESGLLPLRGGWSFSIKAFN